MIDIALLAGVAIVISSVVLVFGCVCHLFKRGSGFTVSFCKKAMTHK